MSLPHTYTIKSVEMYPTKDGFRLDWSATFRGAGFRPSVGGSGILLFERQPDGSVKVDTEMMSKEFVAAVLAKFLEKCHDSQGDW